jgi:hypothetical protein
MIPQICLGLKALGLINVNVYSLERIKKKLTSSPAYIPLLHNHKPTAWQLNKEFNIKKNDLYTHFLQ